MRSFGWVVSLFLIACSSGSVNTDGGSGGGTGGGANGGASGGGSGGGTGGANGGGSGGGAVTMGCDGGTLDCDGGCIDVQSDDLNCGACGNVCTDALMLCRQGHCSCPGNS